MKNYIEIEVTTVVEGCRFTSKHKISRGVTELKNITLEDIIVREASEGAKLGARQAYTTAKRRGGFGRDAKEIENEIIEKFQKAIPGFTPKVYVGHDDIHISQIYHNDWFIKDQGVNPKYPEIPGKFGDTRYTYSYRYLKGSDWVYLHQGSQYYENNYTPLVPPFNHDDVMKFVDNLRSEKYNIKIAPVYIEEEPLQPADGE